MLTPIYFTDMQRYLNIHEQRRHLTTLHLSPKTLCMHILKQVRKTRRKLKMPTALVILELKRLR